jgi:hypothetical protein
MREPAPLVCGGVGTAEREGMSFVLAQQHLHHI